MQVSPLDALVANKLMSVCMALKRRPSIRFRSKLSRSIAREFASVFEKDIQPQCCGDFKRSDSAPLLLLIDRRDDVITPIVRDWR